MKRYVNRHKKANQVILNFKNTEEYEYILSCELTSGRSMLAAAFVFMNSVNITK